jgi:hypothetical protein
MDPFTLLLALHWRKVLLFLAAMAVIGYIQSCLGG